MITKLTTKRVTISDIAKQAGVSKGAAAKVLSGSLSNNIRVGSAKATIIRDIAAKLNYQPNFNARSLAGSSSKVLGILIDSEAPITVFRTLAGIEKQAAAHGYRIMTGESHNNADNLIANYQNFQQYGIDGIIVLSYEYPEAQDKISSFFQWSANTVFLGNPPVPNASCVRIERESAVAEAVKLLYSRGRRTLGMVIGDDQYPSTIQRISGGRKAGCELLFRVPLGDIRQNVIRTIEDFIIPQHIDGVIMPEDLYVTALFRELPHYGLRVPKDLSVIGNGNDTFAPFMMPALTTIDENSDVQATQAVKLLVSMLEDRENGDEMAKQVTVRTKLVVRESA